MAAPSDADNMDGEAERMVTTPSQLLPQLKSLLTLQLHQA
jgi:hypothetical protein